MASLPPGTIGVEYTRATGPSFPNFSSVAQDTSSSTSATSAASATSVVTLGTSFPTSGAVTGALFYRTDLAHLYVFNGSAWLLC